MLSIVLSEKENPTKECQDKVGARSGGMEGARPLQQSLGCSSRGSRVEGLIGYRETLVLRGMFCITIIATDTELSTVFSNRLYCCLKLALFIVCHIS